MEPKTSWADKRVLITGGAGFIGSNLAHSLVAKGATVRLLDNFHPSGGASRKNLAGIDAEMIVADVSDATTVDRAAADQDVIFHCAALTSHPESMADPLGTIRANVTGTATLLETCRRHPGNPTLVHVGTTTQTGETPHALDHATPERPCDVYSASKSAAEKMVNVYKVAHGLTAHSLRTANTYGPRARIDTPTLGFLNYFIGQALRNDPVTVFGTGEQIRNVTYVDDIVNALLVSASHSDLPLGLTLGSDEHLSVAQIAETIVGTIGSGRVEIVPWPAGRRRIDVGHSRIATSEAKRVLNWSATVTFKTGLAKTADFFRRIDPPAEVKL